jgi:hypothetical protein
MSSEAKRLRKGRILPLGHIDLRERNRGCNTPVVGLRGMFSLRRWGPIAGAVRSQPSAQAGSSCDGPRAARVPGGPEALLQRQAFGIDV